MEWRVTRLDDTGSTNDDAKKAAEQGAPAGTVIWALRQSAGRGRQGRQWESPEGNLLFSVVLRSPGGLPGYGFYSFICALAIGDMVRGLLPHAAVELKWPNDVLVDGKKISGILLEAGTDYLIAGIGINVRHYPENPLYPVTSLVAEKADLLGLEALLDKVLERMGHWTEVLEKEGFEPIRQGWLALARKGEMRVRVPNEEISGRFAELDSEGRLHLVLADGTVRKFSAGDVFF